MLARTETRTPRQIADGIAKSSALQRAEAHRIELTTKREAIRSAMDRPRSGHSHANINSQMNALVAQERAIDDELAEAKKAIVTLRETHGLAVSKALAPLRRAAAERIIELLDELRPVCATLQECQALVERAGHQTVRFPSPPLDEIAAIARRLVNN
jgi:hypothetical protein